MSDKLSYYELLKHPLWQKKRLEVMQRAEFSCESCGSTDKMLQVHHAYYEKAKSPWEYPDESLHCLCEDCHREAQDFKTLLNRQLGKVDLSDIPRLLGYAMALESNLYPMVPIEVTSYEVALGIGDCWDLTPEEIISAVQDGTIDGYKLEELAKSKRRPRGST